MAFITKIVDIRNRLSMCTIRSPKKSVILFSLTTIPPQII